jgi:putative ABC transport system permease protein
VAVSREPFADRAYRGLLRILPFDFRSEFGDDMEETFREQRTAGASRGSQALLKMWWATIVDIVRMAPREHVSVLAQDTRYALRMIRQNPGYTLAAVTILGLGIGANTSIFSVVNSVLLKPLPYTDGDGLVVIRQHGAKAGLDDIRFSVAEVNDYRLQNRTLSGLAEYHAMTFTLLGGQEPHRVRTGVVSAGFFDLFGVKPLLGRTFQPDEEKPGAPPVLILSYEFWKNAERGDPNIIGRKYEMNDRAHVVIGVLPPIPQYPNENDVYMTTTACPHRSSPGFIANRKSRMMSVFGRLKPGVTAEQARADLRVVAKRMELDNPETYTGSLGYDVSAAELRGELTHNARPVLLVLLGAAAFVLLIACANVANLILSRMARREKELTIRTAMGAGSGRLLRQLLTESLIMALAAAGVGLAFAYLSLELMTKFAGEFTPRAREIAIDGRVLLFAVACASATTVVCSSLAALYTRGNVARGLKENGNQAAPAARRSLLRNALIAAQVAFSYVLLVGAGLMVHSLIELQKVDPGFVPQRVFAIAFDLNWSKYHDEAQFQSFNTSLLEKVEAQPGVLSAALSSNFPMSPDMGIFIRRFRIEGSSRPESDLPPVQSLRLATPGYFKTLGIPLVAGRTFRDSDKLFAPLVVVINHSLAKQVWNREDPIGKRISFDGEHWLQIVGVVGDVKEFGLRQATPFQVYGSLAQEPANAGTLLVRTAGDPAPFTGMVRRAVLAVDPETAIVRVETLEQAREDSVASPETATRLFGLFAVLALVIAAAGIGSMLALWVRQRMREIGIRMALGAKPGDILRTVVRQGMVLVLVGLGCGMAGALALTRLMQTLLFAVTPTDAATFAAVTVLLPGAALLACYVPARRASRIDPQVALRCE